MVAFKANKNLSAQALNEMTTSEAAQALALAKIGPKFLPLCPFDHKGVSQQHIEDCDKPGKVPLLAKWPDKASDDPSVLNRWFSQRPNLNLGMTLGGRVGVIGFDIDGEYGQTKMEQLFNGCIPPTWEFSTSGGGARFLFSVPKGLSLRKLADANPHADHEELALLADGQMTVIPPSRHQSGGQYRWVTGRGPGDLPLAELPENVLKQLRLRQATPSSVKSGTISPADPVADDKLQLLVEKCSVVKDAVSEQSLHGCSEPKWHSVTSMLVRAGYTDTALIFSRLSVKHDSHSEQRIVQMDAEGKHATYGSTRCTSLGCDKEQIAKCHGTIRLDKQTQEPKNSPVALLRSAKQKAATPQKLSVEQYTDLLEDGFGIHHNKLCQIKYKKEGEPDYKSIANFVARIYKFISKDSGAERSTLYVLDGVLIASKKRLPRIEVPANEFESMKWLSMWGPEPNIFPGNLTQDIVRFAIQSTASAATYEQVFTHLGWKQLDGQWRYLHAGGALGVPDVKVELDTRLNNYVLPEKVMNPTKAMETSLALLEVAPHRVTLVLWALTYLSPLCELLRQLRIEPKFLVWFYGYTGSRKTTLAKLFLCHFGNFLERPPANFKDTANAAEKLGFDAKDSLLLIDDYRPATSAKDKQAMVLLAQQILRAYGDRVGRGRMRQDTTLRPDYLPRGMAIVTAEDMIDGASSVARLFPNELHKTDVSLELLTQAQFNFEKLSEAMKGYLEWVGQAMDTPEKSGLSELFLKKRLEASNLGVHGRLVEASVWLYLGLHLGLKYAESVGTITEEQGNVLRSEAWEIFLDIANEQGEQVTEVRPSTRFVTIVSQMLANHSIHCDSIYREPCPETVPKGSTHVGWHDDDYYYFLPDLIFNELSQFLAKRGEQFPVSDKMLWKELADAGLTHTEVSKENGKNRRHLLVKKAIKRQGRQRLLWVKRDALHEKVEKKTKKNVRAELRMGTDESDELDLLGEP